MFERETPTQGGTSYGARGVRKKVEKIGNVFRFTPRDDSWLS